MRKCGEGEDQDRGIVYMSAVRSVGAGVGAEKGDGGTITITRGTGGFGVAVTVLAWLRLQVLEKKAKWCPFGGACLPQWGWELRQCS
jgi:hypothetical protein